MRIYMCVCVCVYMGFGSAASNPLGERAALVGDCGDGDPALWSLAGPGRHRGPGRALRVRRMPTGDDLGTLEAELGRAGGAANEELLAILQQARASVSVCGCFC